MFGTTRKLPSGRWQARYLTPEGDRITAPTTFGTKAAALRWLSGVETDLARGEWSDPLLGAARFDEVAAQWLMVKAPKLRASTAHSYRYMLRVHICPTFGEREIGKITPAMVHSWLAHLHRDTRLGPNSVAKAYRVMKGVCDFAVTSLLSPRSPCTIKGAGAEKSVEMRVATPEQVRALADAVGERWSTLVLTAAYSGLRWGELCGLRRADVDITAATLTVRRQLVEVDGNLSFGPPKTAAGRRVVALPEFIARELEAHMTRFSEPADDGLIFPSAEGGVLRRSNFRRRVWIPATIAVDLEGLRFHDLRHTGATLAAASGAPLRALMSRLGHSSAAAAIRYQHVLDGQDAAIGRYLDGLASDNEGLSVTANYNKRPSQKGTRRARHLTALNDRDRRTTAEQRKQWWARRDSNPRPPPCKGGALAS